MTRSLGQARQLDAQGEKHLSQSSNSPADSTHGWMYLSVRLRTGQTLQFKVPPEPLSRCGDHGESVCNGWSSKVVRNCQSRREQADVETRSKARMPPRLLMRR